VYGGVRIWPASWIANWQLCRSDNARPQALQHGVEQAADKEKALTSQGFFFESWRREPESNRPKRLCRPLHNRFAIAPEAGTT
jgi:hypothetical protein